MYAFTFFVFPCFLAWYLFNSSKYSLKSFIPPVLIGLISALVLCAFKEFFIITRFTYKLSFMPYWIHDFFNQGFWYVLITFGIFYIFSKDSWEYKIDMTLPLLFSIYSIVFPYTILTLQDKHSFYFLFVYPFIVLSILIILFTLIKTCYDNYLKKEYKVAVPLTLACILLIFIPSLLNSIWYFHVSIGLLTVLSLLIIGAGIFCIGVAKKLYK